jgi:putative ABC transport system permease protein
LESIRGRFPALVTRTNEKLREESIRIFHQTFAVTYALEAIAVIIAVAGLGLALAGLLLERRNELATLRSLGATRRDIARAAMWEGLGIALAGLAGGLAVSFFLGWILIGVINPQSFGWTLRYAVPRGMFVFLSGVTLATAALVAWIVGYRNANLKSDREE